MRQLYFKEKAYDYLVFMIIALSPTISFANYITNAMGQNTSLDTALVFGITAVILMLYVLKNIMRLSHYFFWIILGFGVLFLSLMMHSTMFYLRHITEDLIYNPVFFLAGVFLHLDNKTMRIINVASKYSILISVIILLTDVIKGYIISDHDMVTAYIVLTPTVLLLSDFLQKKKYTDILFAILGIFCIFLYGTRGPLLALVVSFTVLILFFSRSKRKILFCIIVVVFAFFYKDVLIFVRTIYIQLNLGSTRILDMLIAGNINYDNGRKVLHDMALNYIQTSPFIGLGIYGNMANWGFYPHNIFLELFVQLGVPLSILLFLGLFIFGIRRYRWLNINEKYFVVAILSAVLAKLMVTGSYLNEELLFLLFGYLLNWGQGIGFDRNADLKNIE